MGAPKPCRHSRWKRTRLVAYVDHTEDGGFHPDPRKRWRVLECLRCVKCDAAGNRWTRFYGQTERAALKRAGVPENDLPPPPNHKDKPAPAGVLTCWPFPVSTYFPKEKPCS